MRAREGIAAERECTAQHRESGKHKDMRYHMPGHACIKEAKGTLKSKLFTSS